MGYFEFATWDDGSSLGLVYEDTGQHRVTAAQCMNQGAIPATASGIEGYVELPNGTIVSNVWPPRPGVFVSVAIPVNSGLRMQQITDEGETRMALVSPRGYGVKALG
jgi:hypothetical protein